MKEEILVSISQKNCNHWEHKKYTERNFDILNGFELVANRCLNCHKILELKIRSISNTHTHAQTQ
jgi:hypothetical protein